MFMKEIFFFKHFYLRNAGKVWMPDEDYMKPYKKPYFYPPETEWELPPYNRQYNDIFSNAKILIHFKTCNGIII